MKISSSKLRESLPVLCVAIVWVALYVAFADAAVLAA